MQATVTIGDCTVMIEETPESGAGTHKVTVSEEFDGDYTMEQVNIDSENEASEILLDFLNPDEPTGKFADLFPDFCP